jgi:site-specific recombinase XerD
MPEVRVHDLRHSFASNCINQQVSIFEVSKLLGHAQVSTTARYSHLSQETLLAAVEASASGTRTDWGQAQAAKAGENSALVEA